MNFYIKKDFPNPADAPNIGNLQLYGKHIHQTPGNSLDMRTKTNFQPEAEPVEVNPTKARASKENSRRKMEHHASQPNLKRSENSATGNILVRRQSGVGINAVQRKPVPVQVTEPGKLPEVTQGHRSDSQHKLTIMREPSQGRQEARKAPEIPAPSPQITRQDSDLSRTKHLLQMKHPLVKWGDCLEGEDIRTELKFDDCLGEGSFAKVYEGYDKRLKLPVAIKVIDKRKIKDTETKKKALIEEEIYILSKMNHPNIVKFLRLLEDTKRVSAPYKDLHSDGALWSQDSQRVHQRLLF